MSQRVILVLMEPVVEQDPIVQTNRHASTLFFNSSYTKHSLFASLQRTGTVLMLSSVNDATASAPSSALR